MPFPLVTDWDLIIKIHATSNIANVAKLIKAPILKERGEYTNLTMWVPGSTNPPLTIPLVL